MITNYSKILKLLKSDVEATMEDQPELDYEEVLEGILEGIRHDLPDIMKDDEEDEDEYELESFE